jgi:hypothetical protein
MNWDQWPESFQAKVDVTETCWLWTGAVTHNGYGKWRKDGRTIRAHRQAYTWAYGPTGLFVLHECDTPACVRPTHLKAGTHQQNMIDRRTRGTMLGTKYHRRPPIATPDAVREVTQLWVQGAGWKLISGMTGVSRTTVRRIVREHLR